MTKRMKLLQEKFVEEKLDYLTAIKKAQDVPKRGFIESIDVAVKLGVDPRKSDQNVRGAVNLPKGSGKQVKIAVFASADLEAELKKAGAMVVGMEDLADDMKKGNLDYDRIIATPDAMKQFVSKLGQVLGPKGLMPNPKTGSVTTDVVTAVKNAAAGQLVFRTDKAGIVHGSIGRISFSPEDLAENLVYFVKELKRLKPSAAKGIYFQSCFISSTMGLGHAVDVQSFPI
jgi:large subunit ribosomal protein L1